MSSTNTASDELRHSLTKYYYHFDGKIPAIESVKNLLTKVLEDLRYDLLASITHIDGGTMLTAAARRGDTEMCVTLLLSLPPADRLKLILVNKYTALHLAAFQGYTETVSGILSCLTADQQLQLICTQNSFGDTALHDAASKGRTETVKNLLDIITPEQQLKLLSVQNKEGKTASQAAIGYYGTSYTMRTLEHYQKDADYRVNFRKFAKFS